MSETCGSCGQVISKAETLEEIYAALAKNFFPERWEDINVGADAVKVPNLGWTQVVAASDNINDDPGYSDLSTWVVFAVEGRFFKLKGEYSSYAGRSWQSTIKEVSKKPQQIYVYE